MLNFEPFQGSQYWSMVQVPILVNGPGPNIGQWSRSHSFNNLQSTLHDTWIEISQNVALSFLKFFLKTLRFIFELIWIPLGVPGALFWQFRTHALYTSSGINISISGAVILERKMFYKTSYFYCFVIIPSLKKVSIWILII